VRFWSFLLVVVVVLVVVVRGAMLASRQVRSSSTYTPISIPDINAEKQNLNSDLQTGVAEAKYDDAPHQPTVDRQPTIHVLDRYLRWTPREKKRILLLVALPPMLAVLCNTIYLPSLHEVSVDLNTSTSNVWPHHHALHAAMPGC
jgi:hypothetical protein